jgi:hypothetical protein
MVRRLSLLAILSAAALLAACTSPTAPHGCGPGGTTTGSGQCL